MTFEEQIKHIEHLQKFKNKKWVKMYKKLSKKVITNKITLKEE